MAIRLSMTGFQPTSATAPSILPSPLDIHRPAFSSQDMLSSFLLFICFLLRLYPLLPPHPPFPLVITILQLSVYHLDPFLFTHCSLCFQQEHNQTFNGLLAPSNIQTSTHLLRDIPMNQAKSAVFITVFTAFVTINNCPAFKTFCTVCPPSPNRM